MSDKQLKSNMPSVPIWKKMNLTVEEASEYSGIDTSKIKELSNMVKLPCYLHKCPHCGYVAKKISNKPQLRKSGLPI